MAGKHTPRSRSVARRPGNKTSHLLGTRKLVAVAFSQCLAESGVSVRKAARLLRCSKNTVERVKLRGAELLPLRNRKLGLCFVKNLHLLVAVRNGKAA